MTKRKGFISVYQTHLWCLSTPNQFISEEEAIPFIDALAVYVWSALICLLHDMIKQITNTV